MPTVPPPPPLPQTDQKENPCQSLARRRKTLYNGADYHVYSVPKLYHSGSRAETPSALSNKSPTLPNFAADDSTNLIKSSVDSNSVQSVNVLPSNVPTTHYRLSRARSNSLYKASASVAYYPLNRNGRFSYNPPDGAGNHSTERNHSGRHSGKPFRVMNTVAWMSIEDKPPTNSVNSLSSPS